MAGHIEDKMNNCINQEQYYIALENKIKIYNYLKNIKYPHTPRQCENFRMNMRIHGT